MRQPPDTGDLIEIDVVDADPSAFAAADDAAPPRRPRPKWLVPTAVSLAVAATAVVLSWHPWQRDPAWRTFEAPPATVADLTNQLLPAVAPGSVVGQTEPDTLGASSPSSALGFLFAEPAATYGYRRWALFEVTPTSAHDAPAATAADEYTVHGTPAVLSHLRVRDQVEWGPLAGFDWHTASNLFSKDEAIAFAEAVGVHRGQPALRSSYDLGALAPVGSASAFRSAFALERALTGHHLAAAVEPTVVTYLTEEGTELYVASVPAPLDALPVAEFVFGHGADTSVHGLPAVVVQSRDLGIVVTWLEGGRLIAVAGRRAESSMRALAESVRPAVGLEWRQLSIAGATVDVTTVDVKPGEQVAVGGGISASGSPWRASVTIGNPMVTCVYTGPADDEKASCTFSTPLTPVARTFPGSTPATVFVVAVLPIEEFRLVLRVTATDGSISDFLPLAVHDGFTAASAEVAADSTISLVDPSA